MMVVCKYFLQGYCRYGDKCYYEHTRNAGHQNYNRGGSSRYGRGGYHSKGGSFGSNNGEETSNFRGGYNKGGFYSASQGFSQEPTFRSSNQYNVLLDQPHTSGEEILTPTEMLEVIKKDIEEWIQGNMWPFSCYKPSKAHANFPGFEDTSFEELKHEAYKAVKSSSYDQYKKGITDLTNTVFQKRNELMHPSRNTKANLIEICKSIYTPSSNFISSGNTGSSSLGAPYSDKFGSTSNISSTFGSSGPTTNQFVSTSSSTSWFGSSGFSSSNALELSRGSLGSNSQFGAKTTTHNMFGSNNFGQSFTGAFGGNQSSQFSVARNNPFGTNHSNSGSFTNGQIQPASSAFVAPGLFGKVATGSTCGQVTVNHKVYTPIDQLTKEETEEFKANNFTLGKIPLRPPPKELVS